MDTITGCFIAPVTRRPEGQSRADSANCKGWQKIYSGMEVRTLNVMSSSRARWRGIQVPQPRAARCNRDIRKSEPHPGSAHEQISGSNLFWAIAGFSYAAMLNRTGLAQQETSKYAGVFSPGNRLITAEKTNTAKALTDRTLPVCLHGEFCLRPRSQYRASKALR
jgi:hypothetical protein